MSHQGDQNSGVIRLTPLRNSGLKHNANIAGKNLDRHLSDKDAEKGNIFRLSHVESRNAHSSLNPDEPVTGRFTFKSPQPR